MCSVALAQLHVDLERATLADLVGVLRSQLSYGEEYSINNEIGTIYDPDLEDNLPKKLTDLSVKADSFLTVVDDDADAPRVNLSLVVAQK